MNTFVHNTYQMARNEITLDAINWKNTNDFYSSYCDATQAPKWFGRNLDAFLDSLRGGICKITPDKIIVRHFTKKIRKGLSDTFWESVEEICKEEEVVLEIQNSTHEYIHDQK